MGAIGEAIAAYAQPLLDETDGSVEEANRAFALAQICWNLALSPENEREKAISELKLTLNMDDAEFDEFRRSVLVKMIRRHEEMFPSMHAQGSMGPRKKVPAVKGRATTRRPARKFPGTPRNAPCPCGSGKKYKRCCGR